MLFIEVKNLNIGFDGTKVLKNVNLTINEGDVVGILGRSGAGKTVLMHAIRGMEKYEEISGNIIYHLAYCENCKSIKPPSKVNSICNCCNKTFKPYEVDFVKSSLHSNERRAVIQKTAIMLQRTFALYGDISVLDNVANSFNEIGYKKDDVMDKSIDIIEKVQMSHRLMHLARDLSGGEKQRIVLARQLVKYPILLLADEPTGTLDPHISEVVHKVIMDSVNENNMTMIITSHWPEIIDQMADKVILLENGEVIDEGSPKKIVNEFIKLAGIVEKEYEYKIGKPIIKVENLVKKYVSATRGVVNAVNGVSFEVNNSEIFGIAGVSGSGKTTTSEILIGVVQPTGGDINVEIGGEWIDMTKPGPLFRGRAVKYMGILHQEYGLYPGRTVIDNLTESIGLKLPYELGIRKAMKTLATIGFTKARAKSILFNMAEEISEGERHRIALAQVLIKEPKIIIMDEPTGTMDPITKVDVSNSILMAREKMDCTFIIVSHDMEFLQKICDRVAIMESGKISNIGLPKTMIEQFFGCDNVKVNVGNSKTHLKFDESVQLTGDGC